MRRPVSYLPLALGLLFAAQLAAAGQAFSFKNPATLTWNAAPAVESVNLNSGLIAYWAFEEEYGDRTDIISSLVLSEQSPSIDRNAGMSGYAATNSSGSRYLYTGTNPEWQWSSGYTVHFWGHFPGSGIPFAFEDAGYYGEPIFLGDTAYHRCSAGSWCTAVNSFPTDAWTRFCIIWTGSTLKYIVNETVVSEAAASAATLNSAVLSVFGRYNTGAAIIGAIDELAIWDRALNTSELSALWNGGAGLFISSF